MKNIKQSPWQLYYSYSLDCSKFHHATERADSLFPVRGFCINAPSPEQVDRFVKFINEELAPRGVNTLLILVDYNYQFESYPQLRDSAALSKAEVKKIVNACRKNKIRIIPADQYAWTSVVGKSY